MTKLDHIKSFLQGILTILAAVGIMYYPEHGLDVMILLLGCSLTLGGINTLIYYVSMARHMVEGRLLLYKGLISLDLGIYMLALSDSSRVYIMTYLIAMHLFGGILSAARAMEGRKLGGRWRMRLLNGISHFAIVIACILLRNDPEGLVLVYSVGLFWSGCLKVFDAFRRSAIVYIQ